ncbi:putative fimbrial assembly protein, FimB [Hydrogenophaga sp. RAC07]|uniref:hypothetical protein n=1 Tax=Hydrogenophaga sp. RAC07 TaxID=1842537 RepID=UPI00083D7F80|nr:hypothetical protein [Hydrogenophaga sp. RAC07]AOF86547.1 putative fimbrial assembly protein, FimB [Hydrogenophaga sp. RAC07]
MDSGILYRRVVGALPAGGVHLLATFVVASLAAALVIAVWYPYPYAYVAGGRELFLLLVGVDLVCGPVLTMVLFDRRKPVAELVRDLSFVVVIQLIALGYGLHTAWQARPLFLVHEVDRFRVISRADYLGADVVSAIASLPRKLQPKSLAGPVLVGTRPARDNDERTKVMMEAVVGGRDFSQRPEFYVEYSATYFQGASHRALELSRFVDHYPQTVQDAKAVLDAHRIGIEEALFLPVVGRQYWIAILDRQGSVLGYLPGDAFAVP